MTHCAFCPNLASVIIVASYHNETDDISATPACNEHAELDAFRPSRIVPDNVDANMTKFRMFIRI